MKILRFIKKCFNFLRRRGIKGVTQYVENVVQKNDVIGFYNFVCMDSDVPLDKEQFEAHKNDDIKILNWVIPEAGAGSGGHTTIFRFASNLEKIGFHSRIYVEKAINQKTDSEVRDFLLSNFPVLDDRIEFFASFDSAEFAHATIATGWTTAYKVKCFNNTISKFYFVQDFEPDFYAKGSEYQFAENTYKLGYRAITAGNYLSDKLSAEYGMKAVPFGFSYDKDIYVPKEPKDDEKRVFFYARPVTPRRDFELGMLALNELNKKVDNLTVYFAGWDISNYEIPFKHENFGIVSAEKLADCYRACDMCLVISNTNLSLVPLEVMACNSVAVCSGGVNSSWLVNEKNSILVDYEPMQIAEKMAYYFDHPEELEEIRKYGLEFAKTTSWEKEAEKVKVALLDGINEDLAKMN